ncbi:MAG: hypothetical protein V1661_01240 [bacterium]
MISQNRKKIFAVPLPVIFDRQVDFMGTKEKDIDVKSDKKNNIKKDAVKKETIANKDIKKKEDKKKKK